MIILNQKVLDELAIGLMSDYVDYECRVTSETAHNTALVSIYRVDHNLAKKYVNAIGTGEFYLIEATEYIRAKDIGQSIAVRAAETKEGAFKVALSYLHDEYELLPCCFECPGDQEFKKIKERLMGEEKSTVKVRLTYLTGSDEEQEVLDVLREKFNVTKVSKEYKGRDKSPYSNIYVDIEVNKKKRGD